MRWKLALLLALVSVALMGPTSRYKAEQVFFDDAEDLQQKLDEGSLGSGTGATTSSGGVTAPTTGTDGLGVQATGNTHQLIHGYNANRPRRTRAIISPELVVDNVAQDAAAWALDGWYDKPYPSQFSVDMEMRQAPQDGMPFANYRWRRNAGFGGSSAAATDTNYPSNRIAFELQYVEKGVCIGHPSDPDPDVVPEDPAAGDVTNSECIDAGGVPDYDNHEWLDEWNWEVRAYYARVNVDTPVGMLCRSGPNAGDPCTIATADTDCTTGGYCDFPWDPGEVLDWPSGGQVYAEGLCVADFNSSTPETMQGGQQGTSVDAGDQEQTRCREKLTVADVDGMRNCRLAVNAAGKSDPGCVIRHPEDPDSNAATEEILVRQLYTTMNLASGHFGLMTSSQSVCENPPGGSGGTLDGVTVSAYRLCVDPDATTLDSIGAAKGKQCVASVSNSGWEITESACNTAGGQCETTNTAAECYAEGGIVLPDYASRTTLGVGGQITRENAGAGSVEVVGVRLGGDNRPLNNDRPRRPFFQSWNGESDGWFWYHRANQYTPRTIAMNEAGKVNVCIGALTDAGAVYSPTADFQCEDGTVFFQRRQSEELTSQKNERPARFVSRLEIPDGESDSFYGVEIDLKATSWEPSASPGGVGSDWGNVRLQNLIYELDRTNGKGAMGGSHALLAFDYTVDGGDVGTCTTGPNVGDLCTAATETSACGVGETCTVPTNPSTYFLDFLTPGGAAIDYGTSVINLLNFRDMGSRFADRNQRMVSVAAQTGCDGKCMNWLFLADQPNEGGHFRFGTSSSSNLQWGYDDDFRNLWIQHNTGNGVPDDGDGSETPIRQFASGVVSDAAPVNGTDECDPIRPIIWSRAAVGRCAGGTNSGGICTVTNQGDDCPGSSCANENATIEQYLCTDNDTWTAF